MNKKAKFLLFAFAMAALAAFATLSAAVAHPPLPAACDKNNPETCLYISDLSFSIGIVRANVQDAARGNYPIPLLIRYPIGVAGPRPVVIWNHGGNASPKGRKRSKEWGNTLAAAGYVVIHPSRTLITDPTPFMVECQANGFGTPFECAWWVSQYRYGPQNIHFLIDNLALIEGLDPALAGMLDETKIIVGGHSAGSTSVLASAGAWQRWVPAGTQYDERDDRPIAFMASGPQGPMYAGFNSGFQSGSYDDIERPFLFITGVGDETGEPPEARTTGWLRSVAGNKILSWDTEPEAVHETMDIHKCNTPLRADHCRWIGSLGVAYLDAVARGRQEARDWLKSNAYEVLTGGAIELQLR